MAMVVPYTQFYLWINDMQYPKQIQTYIKWQILAVCVCIYDFYGSVLSSKGNTLNVNNCL